MKIRNGFVSNSSSSSFIIHKSYIAEKQIGRLKRIYEELSESNEISDDNGIYFKTYENYIQFNAHKGYEKIRQVLNDFGIIDDQILVIEG